MKDNQQIEYIGTFKYKNQEYNLHGSYYKTTDNVTYNFQQHEIYVYNGDNIIANHRNNTWSFEYLEYILKYITDHFEGKFKKIIHTKKYIFEKEEINLFI